MIQAALCPVCRTLVKIDTRGNYRCPPHLKNGAECCGEGRVVRLISVGLYGGPGWLPIKNGEARR